MKKNFQKILIFIIIFLIIFGIIFAFWFFNGDRQEVGQPLGEDKSEEAENIENNVATSTNSENAKNQRVQDVSLLNSSVNQETGEADLSSCEKIQDSYLADICYDKIANLQLDTQICDNIVDESTKQICVLKIYKAKARQAEDPEICFELEKENLVDNCLKSVVRNNFCTDDECLDEFYNNKESYDSDNDGLTDMEEKYLYKTDPNNSDSDGDGYNDGEEVSGGYNPLGEGKLE